MNKLSKDFLKIGKETINEERKAMKSKRCYLCNQYFNTNKQSKYYKTYKKVRDHCLYTGIYRGAARSLCNLRYQEQRDIPVIIHNGSNYDFHLLIKDLAKEFKSDIHCLGENTRKYISFSVKIDTKKIDNETINCSLKFLDCFRFISSSLDSLVDNLSEINNKTCNSCKEKNKTIQNCGFVKLNKNRLMFRYLNCKVISYNPLQPLINKFSNTCRLFNNKNERLILLIRKGIYPYEHIDDWKRFNETEPPSKEEFYSNLNMKSINDKDCEHVKNIWKTFNIKHLGEYRDLYVQSDTLLLSDVFEAFQTTCIKEYKLDQCCFVSTPGLSWEACLKLTKVRLELLTDIGMLLMFEKGIRGGISQAILKYEEANNHIIKM